MSHLAGFHRLGIALISALLATACSRCVEINLQEARSPDGKFSARILERHCDGPHDSAQRLVLNRAGWLALFNREGEPFALEGLESLQLAWANNRSLEVWYSGGAVLQKAESWKDIRIAYHGPQLAAAQIDTEAPSTHTTAPMQTSEHGIWHGGEGRRGFGHGSHRRED